jgi:uncharacterized protein (TIGR03437 family)
MRFRFIASTIIMTATTAFAQPSISTGGVIDGAGFVVGRAVAPGSLVSIFGTSLSSMLQAGDTVPLSMSLNSTSVTFNGIPAGLYFVSGGQVNAQLPWNLPTTGTVNAVVTSNGVASAAMAVPVNAYAPSIFTANAQGTGYAIAINPDGTLAAPNGAIPGLTTHPAKIGDTLILYANGLGPLDSTPANGDSGGATLRNTTTLPVVTISGTSAQVPFSGLTPQFPGIDQVNFVVPKVTPGDSLPLLIQIGGVPSPSGVLIAVGN